MLDNELLDQETISTNGSAITKTDGSILGHWKLKINRFSFISNLKVIFVGSSSDKKLFYFQFKDPITNKVIGQELVYSFTINEKKEIKIENNIINIHPKKLKRGKILVFEISVKNIGN